MCAPCLANVEKEGIIIVVIDVMSRHNLFSHKYQGIIPSIVLNGVEELSVPASQLEAALKEARDLPKLTITKLDCQWLQVLGEGWAAPLTGFMREREFLQCQHFGCLQDGGVSNQSIPIVLPVSKADKDRLQEAKCITLVYEGR